jgi:hypothetical protein
MRLTLRTLLAYRDQVLEPKDSAILEQRIRESRTAQSLSDRIDQLIVNPKVSSIAIDARDFGLDPNDVACFLDDAMPADRLPEMEKKCLENNALLAEVASCHQILVRAISVPVNVSPAFRNRVIGLHPSARSGAEPAEPKTEPKRLFRYDAPHAPASGPRGLFTDDAQRSIETRDSLEQGVLENRRIQKELGGAGIELEDRLGSQVPEYLRGTDKQWLASGLRLVILLVLLGGCIAQSLSSRQRLLEMLDRKTNDWSSAPKEKLAPEPSGR